MWFEQYPEFVSLDPRKDRQTVTVTSESLTKRCKVMLPAELIEGKTILDIGSALGAMGKWALENGAALYHGVEIQEGYRTKSIELLTQYDNAKIFQYLSNVEDQYDIVIVAGVIHGHFNLIEILQNICAKSSNYIILETHLIKGNEPNISLKMGNMVNYNDINKPFTGIELVPNKTAIDLLMAINGFVVDKDLYPEPITGSHDAYDVNTGNRFIARYRKMHTNIKTLQEAINVAV